MTVTDTDLRFDENTNLIPLTPAELADMTERQRKAFARYAAAHRIVRSVTLTPVQRELMAALDEVNAADSEVREKRQ